jgi:hypothetical protein
MCQVQGPDPYFSCSCPARTAPTTSAGWTRSSSRLTRRTRRRRSSWRSSRTTCGKLERLGKIEQGVTLGRIEELLGHTDSSEDAATTTKAIHALGNALTTLPLDPIPTERSAEFYRRVRTISSALDLVASVVPDVPAELMQACEPHGADLLLASKTETNVPMPAYAALYEAARQVMARLLERGDRVHAVQ